MCQVLECAGVRHRHLRAQGHQQIEIAVGLCSGSWATLVVFVLFSLLMMDVKASEYETRSEPRSGYHVEVVLAHLSS